MKVVFPVTRQNCRLYGQLALLFEKAGVHKNHGIVVIACPSAMGEASEFIEKVKRYFGEFEIYEAASEVTNTHGGRNRIFRDAAMLLHKHGNRKPWIWMEHAYPTDRNWLEMVQQEWDAKPVAQKFLGCIETAYRCKRDEKGNILKERVEDFEDIGPFMRFGVYPPDFLDICPYARYQNGVPEIPFEVDLRGTIAPLAHQSRTIESIWASRNWHNRGGSYYTGEQDPEFELEIRRSERTSTDLDGVAIVHGCRDGTMGAALLKRHWSRTDFIPPVDVKNPSKAQAATIYSLRARVSELEAELESLRAKIAGEEVAVHVCEQEPDTIAPESEPTEDAPQTPEPEPAAEETPAEAPAAPPKKRRGRPRKQQPINV